VLTPCGNLDNDGQFNIAEWQESGNDVEFYLARTLNDERAPDKIFLCCDWESRSPVACGEREDLLRSPYN
jgi:hypothetical protein